MVENDHISDDAIADQIAKYLASRPQAADSLSGISRWWLTGAVRNAPLESIQKALDKLVAQDLMHTEVRADGEVIYLSSQAQVKGDTDE